MVYRFIEAALIGFFHDSFFLKRIIANIVDISTLNGFKFSI